MKRAVILAVLLQACPAYAQSDEVVLALACFGETGWDVPMCAVQTWIHVERGGGTRNAAATARLYSSFLKSPGARGYMLNLRPFGPPPPAWTRGPHWWRRYQRRFRDLVKVTWSILHGQVPNPCPDAEHYGGPEELDPFPDRWVGVWEEDPTCAPATRSRQRVYRRVRQGVEDERGNLEARDGGPP